MREPTEFFTKAALRRRHRQQRIETLLVATILLGTAVLMTILIYFWRTAG